MLRKEIEFGFVRQLIVWLLVFLFPIASWAEEGAQKWACETGGYVYSSPAIGADGIIYVGSRDFKLYAIDPEATVNPDGTMPPKWTFETGNRVYSSPAVGADGTIYVGSHDFRLYAINPNGTKKWGFVTGSWVESSPAIGSDGTIYVGSWDEYLYAVNPEGTEKWAFKTGGYVKSCPAIGSDGTIYVGSDDHYLYAINPDGTQKWAFETENRVRSSPAIGADGTIYVGSDDCNLYAINPSGTKKWEFATGGFVYSSPAVGSDGTIYVGSDDKKVYAIDPMNGAKKWEFTTGGLVYSSPAIGADGTIYVGSNDYRLYAISSDGDATGTFETGGYVWSSPVIGDDGTVYVGSGDQNFYAVTWIPDTTPPTVNSTSPANNATDVGVNTVISATFSEVMAPPTITIATFLVSNGTSNIAGTVNCSGATASFTPTGALEYDTVYTGTITTGAEDLAGNALESDYTWSFTTCSYTGPMISLYPVSLSNSCQGGQNAPNQSFQVWNSGGDTLSYVIEDDVAWLSCAPASGASTGEHDTITVEYATSGLASGTHSATITVSASGASNSPQTIGVTLTVGSHPPVADAGVDQAVNERNLVTLDGSGSTDPDDGIASYHWQQTGGSPIVTLEGADTAVASFTAPDVGDSGISLIFELTVSDNSGLQDTDTCVVDVTGENDPPTANAGPNQTVEDNATVTLNGSNSTDTDDGIDSYHWQQTGGSPTVSLAGADTAEASFTAPDVDPGGTSLTFELTVTDTGGLQDTDTCIVNVTWENDPPTANAGPNQTVEDNATVTLNGSNSTDTDDGIDSYHWQQTGGSPTLSLAGADTAEASFTAPDVDPGGTSLTFELTVRDNGGLQDTDTCIVNVTWENDPPTANAGPNQTVDKDVFVTLSGLSSTDPDDGILSYHWQQTGGSPTVTVTGADTAEASFTAPDVDPDGTSLTFELTVTDNGGLQDTDTCIVNVTGEDSASSPPPASPGVAADGGGGGGGGCFISTAAHHSHIDTDSVIFKGWKDARYFACTLFHMVVTIFHEGSPQSKQLITKKN